jgi:hypothetical protein
MVAGGQDHQAFCAGQNLLRILPFVDVASEPRHFAMLLALNPIGKVTGAFRGSGTGKTTLVKAQLQGAVTDGILHF